MDAKRALEESSDDFEKARTYLKEKGIEKAAKKSDREINAGRIFAYVHGEGTVGTMVKLGCETDFVAKNDEFEKLGNEIAMQVAAMKPESVEDLLEQDYIRDPSKKVNDLITEAVAKIGENITIAKTACFEV